MDLYKIFNESNSLTEVLRKLNMPIGGSSWYKIKEKAIEIGFDINEYKKRRKKYCNHCNKELIRGQYKFCSSSCSATYNNRKREHANKTKEKISKSLIEHYFNLDDGYNRIIIDGKIRYLHRCIECDKEFNSRRKNIRFCSTKCSNGNEKVKAKLRKAVNRNIEKGIHKGWQSRNIRSYPELFWVNVLNNNNIEFTEELKVGKYFIDFYIEINNKKIALEIDGKQHLLPERIKSDKEKDVFLESKGYTVYRIPWNSINNEIGKQEMKNKIDKFIKFLHNV